MPPVLRLAFLPLGILVALPAGAATLQDVIKHSINTHPEVSASVNSRLSADQDLRVAKGGYLPSINLTAGTGREQTDSPTTRASGGTTELSRSESGISLQQTLFDGFATSSEVGRQRATVNSRAYKVMNTSESVALSAVQVYMDVLQRTEFVKLAQNNLANHERIYDQIRLRSEQGVARLADLEQAEARLAQARNNLYTEQTNLDDAKANFFSVTGMEADNLSMPDVSVLKIPGSLDEARRIMVASSPLLKSAESDIKATEQQYQAAKSSYYPHVNIELERSMNNNVDGVRGSNNEWQAMVRMRYNLYQGGSNMANTEAKAYQIKEAQDIRNNALRQLNEELRLAWNALNNARRQIPIASNYADRSLKVRNAYQKQFSIGERTLLDLLDSESELLTAQRRLVEIQFIERFTEYRIKARMGDLLNNLSIQSPTAGQSMDNVATNVDLPSLN